MKLNKIFNMLSVAAVALFATACNDTDAQYSIPKVGAPEFVSITPSSEQALVYGKKTITVKFDRNIGFATENTSKITLNGTPVSKALVLGASDELTITADVSFDKTQRLVIPAGLILGPQGDAYTSDIDVTFTIKDLPSNEAKAMTEKLGWGWNLGNHFDTSGDAISKGWGYWDGVGTLTDAPFKALAAIGAKTVRIPATWTDHMAEGTNVIDAAYLDEVAATVDLAIAAGLNVILNTHHDSFETNLGNAAKSEVVAKSDSTIIAEVWSQVAKRFADYGDKLIFETFNEVHAGDDWSTGASEQFDLLNKWNQYAVDAIRKAGGNNSTRWIGVAGYAANIDLTINNLVLPEDPANHIMVGVHCYDPYAFCTSPLDVDADTVVVNSWGHNADPGYDVDDSNEDVILNQLYKLRTAYIEKGIPCYLGEFGCVYQPTEKANAFRRYYLEFFCRAANLAGIPVMIWDNNVKGAARAEAGEDGKNHLVEAFGYLDHATGEWLNDSPVVVPVMIKATTSTDSSYDFQSIWNTSPTAN
ncbi:MAG: cellulase family glycosylhydrolase [Prevotella sp.]|nr:cellulase family glycosylhydrolase [Prevotella sp.]